MTPALAGVNEPRALLDLPVFDVRVGVSTGPVHLGNVGTYDKMDFTAFGKAVNLGARIEQAATDGVPCISRATREDVGDRFTYRDPNGRTIRAKNFDPVEVQVWEVTGRRAAEVSGGIAPAGQRPARRRTDGGTRVAGGARLERFSKPCGGGSA
jgi:class 3 adenylate cyclase